MRVTDTHYFFWDTCFSNFHRAIFYHQSHIFHNSEQAFMWEKAMYFGDEKSAVDIQVATNPAVAKKLGRKVRGYDDKLWSLRREYFMFQVNMMKYTQNPLLADELLATQNKVLVEASPYDTIWGIGLHYEDNLVLDEANWRGNNLLGKTLMKVRDRLREIKEVKSIYKKQRS